MALDNFRTIELIWDKANKSIIKTIKTASSDTTGRYLSVKILDGGQEVTLNNAKLQLYWEHPNFNTSGTDDFETMNNGGLFKMTFSDGMLTNIGVLNAHLVLILPDGKITSDGFAIEVIKGANDGVVVPTNGKGLVEQVARKIDKGNVTLSDLTQDVKLAMTGGSVAVVGENAVGTENIKSVAVTPSKTTFFEISKNLFNPESVIRNKTFDTSGNVIDDSIFWVNSDFIPVNQGETIRLTSGVYRIATYNEDKSFISRSGTDVNGVYTLTASSIKFIRISGTVDPNIVMLNKGSSLLPFEVFGSQLKESVIPKSITNSVNSAVEKVANMEDNQKHVYEPIEYTTGTVGSSGAYETGNNAFRTSEDIELSAGDKLTVASGYRIFIVYLTTSGTVKSFAWLEENSVYTASENEKVRFMVRTSENAKPAEIADFVLLKKSNNLVLYGELSNVSGGQGGDVVKYVGLNGNDSDSGDSKSNKYATLQKAINEGASTIFIERGDYYNQSASLAVINKLTILPLENNSNAKVRFIGADKLTGWTADNGIYKLALSNGVNFKEVFTDKTLPPMTSTSRPAPNAVLWEAKDYEMDYMMTPVLTLAECQSTQGTFFWDGTTVYINPQNINNDFWLPKISNGIDLSSIGHLIAQDLVVDYYLNQPLRLEDISKLEISGVEAHHSAKTDGFSLDYTYGDLKNCKAYKNRNDGYNNHFEGNINLYNCEGINNFDDGASPHENATVTVYGGIYRGNGKGGVIPAFGGTARVYNAILQDNKIGFHNATESKGSVSSGNLYIGNETGLRNDGTGDNGLVSVNDKFSNNTADTLGVFPQY